VSLALVTGFGAFESVAENPSEAVARALERRPPPGLEVVAAVLPVSFERAPLALDEALGALRPRRPALLLSLGVQSRGAAARFRLERLAARLKGGRADVDGRTADGLALGEERRAALDLERLARELAAGGVDELELSADAGGYVCEGLFHHALGRGLELGLPALFLHLPRAEQVALARQIEVVGLVLALAAGATSPRRGAGPGESLAPRAPR
jgi:pyrrolidone-carboxylate peptidase